MVRVFLFDPIQGRLEQGDASLIARWRAEPHTLLWCDIAKHDTAAEERLLREAFDLHPLAIQDALRDRHPPKIETFDNTSFVLLRGLDTEASNMEFGVLQLALFIGRRALVTRHSKTSVSIEWLWQEVVHAPELMREGPSGLAVRVVNRLVRRYLDILLAFEPRLDAIETEIFSRPDDRLLAELTRYKSRLRHLARIANYHLQVVGEMRRDPGDFIEARFEHEVIDIYEQLERTASLADLYYETASDLTDGYLAFASHRLNRVMQILTIFTVIFVPLSFLAGVYGMNFDNMPELHSPRGYYVLLTVMGLVACAQLAYFKLKHWL